MPASETVKGPGPRSCSDCGRTGDDVLPSPGYYTAWGHNAFDFAWQKVDEEIILCETCDNEEWRACEKCGYMVPGEYYGIGYTPPGSDGDELPCDRTLCPSCAKDSGYELDVAIADPPPRVTHALKEVEGGE